MKITKRQLKRLILNEMNQGGPTPPPGMIGASQEEDLLQDTGIPGNEGVDGATLFIDYRSPPSGLGTVVQPDGSGGSKKILIQHEGSNPNVSPGIYDQVVLFTPPGSTGEEDPMQQSSDYVKLVEWLRQNFGVTTVIDTELSFGNMDSVEREIPIDEWLTDVTAGW